MPESAAFAALGLQDRAQALVNAFIDLGSDLDMHAVLTRVIGSACDLTGARHGAIGVLGPGGGLVDVVTRGLSAAQRARIDQAQPGGSMLELLMEHPEPLRLRHLQDHPGAFGFPPGHAPLATFLGVPLRVHGTVFGSIYLTEKVVGSQFTDEDELVVQALATAAGYVVENARAFAQSERRREWLEASVRMSESLQPPIQLGAALQQVVVIARSVTHATTALVMQRTSSERYVVSAGDGPQAGRGPELAEVLREEIEHCEHSVERQTVSDGEEDTIALVPLTSHLAARGVLVVLLDSGRGFLPAGEQELLTAFADQASLALDRAQAMEDREDLAVVSDRDRIARDLHDLVIQQIFATGLRLQAAGRMTAEKAVAQRINQTVIDLDSTIRDIRATVFALQSAQPQSLQVGARSLIDQYVPVLGFTPSLRTTGHVNTLVPQGLVDHLLAVLREALSNVARHAHATRAALHIEVREDEVFLRVADDGDGLHDHRTESGLKNVRRRAHELGGLVRLYATDPHGTTIEWRVPLRPGGRQGE